MLMCSINVRLYLSSDNTIQKKIVLKLAFFSPSHRTAKLLRVDTAT